MSEPIKVWDLAVRVFHWSLVVSFALAYITGEENETLHVYLGYAIAGLIVFRFIWGFVGGKYARFRAFLYSPKETLSYLRDSKAGKAPHYLSHNPLGALMVFALLFTLSGTVVTGLALNGDLPGFAGGRPEASMEGTAAVTSATSSAQEESEEDETEEYEEAETGGGNSHDLWEEWHEGFANATLVLIALHIFGVIMASRQHKENLVRAMITGWKQQR